MYIETHLYSEIVKSLPIMCVDLIITVPQSDDLILVQRREEPLKGTYWPPGGRKMLGETFLEAAKRIAKTELQVLGDEISFEEQPLGLYHDIFDRSSFGTHEYETFSVIVKGTIAEANVQKLQPDKTSEKIVIGKAIPPRMLDNTIFFK